VVVTGLSHLSMMVVTVLSHLSMMSMLERILEQHASS
jgi:hypothetical protein